MSAPAGNIGSSGSTEYGLLSQMFQNHNQTQEHREEPRIIPPMQVDPRLATLHSVHSQGGFAVAPHDLRDEPRVGPPGMTPYVERGGDDNSHR
jgi:hypothetical protein